MEEIKVKTFIHALNVLHRNVKEAKKYLADKRLTQAEKKILNCWFLLRENKFIEIFETLNSIPLGTNQIIETQKKLIFAITLNNKSEFLPAKDMLDEVVSELESYNLPNQKFIASFNLFIAHLNLKNEVGMKKSLAKLTTLEPNGERQLICLYQSHFNYQSFIENFAEARIYLTAIENLKIHMSEPLIMTHLICKYIFTVKVEDWAECQATLVEMKSYRSFNSSSNYIFMKTLLDHFVYDTPLYIYKNKFEHYPMLYSQLKVIQNFQESDHEGALTHWKNLQSMFPEIYLDDFNYQGDKTIFSLCLAKHLKMVNKQKPEVPISASKEDALVIILQNATGPIRKELLYELVWGEFPSDKEDLYKMKKMISRCREKGLEIQYKKGCYVLIQPAKTGAA